MVASTAPLIGAGPASSMLDLVRRWVIGGAILGGGVGGLVPLGIEAAYWLGFLDPVVPHYLNRDVLFAWPTAGWLLSAGKGGVVHAFLILAASILANGALYTLLGGVAGAVAGAIDRVG